jgi:hypothetical protein
MAGCSSEPAVFALTGENKVDGLFPRESFREAKKMQGCQAPVYAIQTKMLCEPIFQLIPPLASPVNHLPHH